MGLNPLGTPEVWLFCAGPSLERARPLVAGLKKCNVEVNIRTDDHLNMQNPPIKSGDFVLVLWSQFFTGPHGERLAEICDAAGKAQARVLNDIKKLQSMQDRRWLLKKLQDHGLPTPVFVECSRDGGADVPDTMIEEHEDYIVVRRRERDLRAWMVGDRRINKPFVEKPVDRRDRDIYAAGTVHATSRRSGCAGIDACKAQWRYSC
ncbi:Inositol hexakisphosphate and diphosphoinositol-pentakisphosphate kinase (InsP6 and PP-IP5 kinase) [Durusdinium trenchii]|uniref:Inositol hexakisphosphate and diphosphoinositol-pentakisphosphate kinase (InsP6 and PP-IP5 kinase) n=1 Tax=Durusdinium trenchii TaxID=1381693 RepID=A0ABP0HKU2_9DINO